MLWENIKDWLRFNRKERIGIIVLVVVILALYSWPSFLSNRIDARTDRLARLQVELLKKTSTSPTTTDSVMSGDEEEKWRKDGSIPERQTFISLLPENFSFDPNTTDEAGWKKLGLSEKIIRTILHFIDRGGRFRKPEDIHKIYGLPEKDARRLLPHIIIPGTVKGTKTFPETQAGSLSPPATPASTTGRQSPMRIEINRAEWKDWMKLQGIDPALAGRIMRFRDKLGGFFSVQQIAETYGLPDSIFVIIKPWLLLDSPAHLRKIDLNQADTNTLRSHPYIGWRRARLLLAWRTAHGAFPSLEALREIHGISPEELARMEPYLMVSGTGAAPAGDPKKN